MPNAPSMFGLPLVCEATEYQKSLQLSWTVPTTCLQQDAHVTRSRNMRDMQRTGLLLFLRLLVSMDITTKRKKAKGAHRYQGEQRVQPQVTTSNELWSTFRAIYLYLKIQQYSQVWYVCKRSLRENKMYIGAQHAGPSFTVQPAVPMAKQTSISHGRVASATGGGSCSKSGRGHGLRFLTERYLRRQEICTVARDHHLRQGRTKGGRYE
ncbi:unnamed protein product [Ectocarpus fasciculatus]